MGFNIRHYPENVQILIDKLHREGSHFFYNMYIKRVECWMGSDSSRESEQFIKDFMIKYGESCEVFHSL